MIFVVSLATRWPPSSGASQRRDVFGQHYCRNLLNHSTFLKCRGSRELVNLFGALGCPKTVSIAEISTCRPHQEANNKYTIIRF